MAKSWCHLGCRPSFRIRCFWKYLQSGMPHCSDYVHTTFQYAIPMGLDDAASNPSIQLVSCSSRCRNGIIHGRLYTKKPKYINRSSINNSTFVQDRFRHESIMRMHKQREERVYPFLMLFESTILHCSTQKENHVSNVLHEGVPSYWLKSKACNLPLARRSR